MVEDVFFAVVPIVVVLAVLYRLFGGVLQRQGGHREQYAQPEAEMRRHTQAGPEGLRDQLRQRAESLRQERLGGIRARAGGAGVGVQHRAGGALESPWIEEEEGPLEIPSELLSGEGIYGRVEPEEALSPPVAAGTPPLRPYSRRARRGPRLTGFASRQLLRRAMVAREVLGPPKGLQPSGE